MVPASALGTVLAEAQRVGLIGAGSLDDALAQAHRVAAALPTDARRIVDIGSGGGLPGLVVAADRPGAEVVLVDRRGRACDLLRRGVAALEWGDRVCVVHADVALLGRDPQWRSAADAVTARGFGPPGLVAELGLPLVRPGGVLVVTAAGRGQAWSAPGLAELGARVLSRDDGLVVVLAGECPARYPRARPRPPLF